MMDISAVIIDPDLLCPWVFTRWSCIKEKHICLYPLGVKYPCREAQDSMQFHCLHQLLSYGLTCTPFKKDVVRQYDCRPAVCLQHGSYMLNKVELLITGGCPEVLTNELIKFCRILNLVLALGKDLSKNPFLLTQLT